MTGARYSWQLGSEGSLASLTYCEKGHPFIIVMSEDPIQSNLCQSFSSVTVTNYFYDLGLSRLGFQHPTFR